MDDIKGTNADETINATAVSATTGAAVTNLSSGDKIDGGTGTDTLNVTLTAANNSLTGVSVSNVEVVNITGANNTAASTSAAASANAGAKQVQVLDIANMSLEAEQQTISYVGLAKSTTAGALTLSVLGKTVTTASIAASADAATIATAVATAINASEATPAAAAILGAAATDTVKGLVTATATSGVVTLKYAVKLGDAAATTQGNTGLVTAGTATPAAPTITETVTSSAELQDLDLDTWVKVGTGAATVTVLGTTVTTASIADDAADTVVATAVATAINLAAATSGNALVGKVFATVASGSDNVILTYAASVGNAAAAAKLGYQLGATGSAVFDNGAAISPIAKAADVSAGETRKGGEVDLTVSVNGANYTVTSVVDGDVLSATGATAITAQNTSKDAARNAIKTQLSAVLGDGVTVGDSDQPGEIKLTAKTTGTAIPSITATGRDSATNLISEDSADAAKVANAEITSASGAVAQQVQYTVGGTTATGDKFAIYIDGVSYGTVNPTSTTPISAATPLAAGLNAILGTGVAVPVGGTITITAPTAGVPLPVISITATDADSSGLTFARTDLRDNVDVLGTTTTTSGASVSGASFTGSEQVWLVGADSNKANLTVTTQTAGLDGVTGLANKITFGASGALAVKSSAGTVDIAGAASGLAISGSGTATGGLVLTNTTATTTAAAVKAISVDTTGATSLDVSALSNLTSVTSTGAGGVTVNPKALATKLASITSGAGADTVRINTATVVDNTLTAADETVNAAVGTGEGKDTIRVKTSGAGTTTVNSGEGDDTVRLTAVSTGVATVEAGAGNDTVYLDLAIGGSPKLTVDAGDGTDTLVMAGGTLTAVDYLRLNTALSGFETVKFITNGSGTIDASLLDVGALSGFTFTAGSVSQNVISKVSGQKLTLTDAAAVTTATDFTPSSSASSASGLKATALDYKLGASIVPTTYGEALDVAVSGNASVALTLAGSAATVAVSATGASTDAKSIAPTVTLGGAASDLQSLTVNLTSARGTSTNAANEYVATFDAGTLADTGDTSWNEHLEALSSLKVNGTGVFTINNTGSDAITRVSLTNIDVSGMEAFSNLADDGTLANNTNRSTTSITLNDLVSEVVSLGGAKDTVVTGSTVPAVDTIVGFQLSAKATSSTTVDTDRSDVLNVPGTLSFVKFETEATTLAAALTEAGAYEATAGTATQNVVFNFGGDTYVYADRVSGGSYTAVEGLDDGDFVVRLVGNYDVDLLVGVVS